MTIPQWLRAAVNAPVRALTMTDEEATTWLFASAPVPQGDPMTYWTRFAQAALAALRRESAVTILTKEQVYLLLDRLKWEPVFEDDSLVLAKKRRGGYSDDATIGRIEAALSIMLEAAVMSERRRTT